jgi:tripartite ATP-independent transporter DctM subunit
MMEMAFVVFFVLLLLGVPIVLALGVASLAALLTAGVPLSLAATRMFAGLDSFPLMAVPFFILAGELMNVSGFTDRIVKLANALVGHLTAGLAQVNVVDSMLFAGISGSSAADVSSIGSMVIRAMTREGYPREFTVSLTAVTACIANIIPPSLFMILLGAVTGISVGGMFLAGFVPGILIGFGLMVFNYIYCKKMNIPVKRRPTAAEFWEACKEAAPALGTAVIILGGIEFGIVTPTEAGVLAVVYTAFVGMVVYHDLTLPMLHQLLIRASKTTAIAVSVLAPASIFSWIMARESLPDLLTRGIKQVASTPLEVHLLIMVVLLILGMFMEATSVLIIVMPFLFPVAIKAGLDPIHFGICSTVALVIGLVTPPVGMLLFLACAIGKTTVKATLWTLYPQIAIMVFVLLLIVLFPQLTTFLPRFLLKL